MNSRLDFNKKKMKKLYEFSYPAPMIEKCIPPVKLVYESTQIKDTQPVIVNGQHLSTSLTVLSKCLSKDLSTCLSLSDEDVKSLRNSIRVENSKIVQDSEEDLDYELCRKIPTIQSSDDEIADNIQTTHAKVCSNDKCKTVYAIEWKKSTHGILCCTCYDFYSKFGSFNAFKKESRPITSKNFNFLKSPRRNLETMSSPNLNSRNKSKIGSNIGSLTSRKRRATTTRKRNYLYLPI